MRPSKLQTLALLSLVLCAVACSASGASGTVADDAGTAPDSSPQASGDGGTRPDGPAALPDAEVPSELEAQFAELPVSGPAGGPIASAITIKCAASPSELSPAQASSGAQFPGAFVQVISVTDPQGVTDIDGPTQQLVLFSTLAGATPESHQFDIESYGIYFGGANAQAYFAGSSGQAIRETWCAKPWWPAEITITDETGHVTKAKIRIPVVR